MPERRREANELIISYMTLRKVVGWIGVLLPVVLLAGELAVFSGPIPASISDYYYTHMRNVLEGSLCALGVFLLAYAGYDEWDRWITNAAGLFALGVAFFPTSPPAGALTAGQRVVGAIHMASAALTFIALAVMALRFAKTAGPPERPAGLAGRLRLGLGFGAPGPRTARKKARNVVYRACAIAILACLALAGAAALLPVPAWRHLPLVYAFESLAIFAFGVSWFVKGGTLTVLADR